VNTTRFLCERDLRCEHQCASCRTFESSMHLPAQRQVRELALSTPPHFDVKCHERSAE